MEENILSDVENLQKRKGQAAEEQHLIEKFCSFLIIQIWLLFPENSQAFGNFKLKYFHTWIRLVFFSWASKTWVQNPTFDNSDKQNVTIWLNHAILQPY